MSEKHVFQTVFVTGFGPFGNHPVNASWEAVKLLPEIWNNQQVRLEVKEVPVAYQFVQDTLDTVVPENACLVIHVGVSGEADKLYLESRANNAGYGRPDVNNARPPDTRCVPSCQEETLATAFDLQKLVEKAQRSSDVTLGVEVCTSDDAGRFLCEFIYFKSLHSQNGRALFIHVPPVGKPYSSEQVASCIKEIIDELLLQLP